MYLWFDVFWYARNQREIDGGDGGGGGEGGGHAHTNMETQANVVVQLRVLQGVIDGYERQLRLRVTGPDGEPLSRERFDQVNRLEENQTVNR